MTVTKSNNLKFVFSEFVCAVTMTSPLVSSLLYLKVLDTFDTFVWLVFFGCFVHAPFSIMFHLRKCIGDDAYKGIGLILRRLDYTFIHVSCVMLSMGMSRSLVHGVLALIFNIRCICTIWIYDSKRYGPQKPPIHGVAVCTFLYVLPLLIYNNGAVYFWFVSLIFGVCYILVTRCDVYGYAMMHVLIGVVQFVLLKCCNDNII